MLLSECLALIYIIHGHKLTALPVHLYCQHHNIFIIIVYRVLFRISLGGGGGGIRLMKCEGGRITLILANPHISIWAI